MSQTNLARAKQQLAKVKTHGGAPAIAKMTPIAMLRRTITTCLLWEKNFYESGESVAARVRKLVPQCAPEDVLNLAVEVRKEFYLRHAPMLLVREMARATPEHRKLVKKALVNTINRPDELNEFLSLYWSDNDKSNGKDGKTLSAQVKRGLAAAFAKFDKFSLSKWDNKEKEVRIRDVMFYVHAKPKDVSADASKWTAAERKAFVAAKTKDAEAVRPWAATPGEELQYMAAQDMLKQEGTWEARMSGGESALDVFTDLIDNDQLHGMAFIRNLRKMKEAKVPMDKIVAYSRKVNLRGVLPHQFITAARYASEYESIIEEMMFRSMTNIDKLPGKTVILVDVSGSMDAALSQNLNQGNLKAVKARLAKAARTNMPQVQQQETTRIDAAAAIAIMARELCEQVEVYTFSNRTVRVPDRRGMALRDAIHKSQMHSGTELIGSVNEVTAKTSYDRIIVITDEQATDTGRADPHAGSLAYVMNVAPYEYSIAHPKAWVSISGWSPQVLRYINEHERQLAAAE